jgi:hypothetical protein
MTKRFTRQDRKRNIGACLVSDYFIGAIDHQRFFCRDLLNVGSEVGNHIGVVDFHKFVVSDFDFFLAGSSYQSQNFIGIEYPFRFCLLAVLVSLRALFLVVFSFLRPSSIFFPGCGFNFCLAFFCSNCAFWTGAFLFIRHNKRLPHLAGIADISRTVAVSSDGR